MQEQPRIARNRQIAVRLSEAEHDALILAAEHEERRPADLARLLITRGTAPTKQQAAPDQEPQVQTNFKKGRKQTNT